VEVASRKIQTYQNKAKNTIYFVFDLTVNANSLKQNIILIKRNMFFLAATLVG